MSSVYDTSIPLLALKAASVGWREASLSSTSRYCTQLPKATVRSVADRSVAVQAGPVVAADCGAMPLGLHAATTPPVAARAPPARAPRSTRRREWVAVVAASRARA